MRKSYFLSLGTNIEPEENLARCVAKLRKTTRITGISQVYETQAIGDSSQPNYLNAVVRCESALSPLQFQTQVIGEIEKALGRIRTADKYAPRTIDIDILLVNQDILKIEHRPIPSPEIMSRAFVTIPLAEIAPDDRHPENQRRFKEIARQFEDHRATMIPRPDIRVRLGKTSPPD